MACSPLGVVNSISKAWCVHYGQLQLDTLLLNVHCVLDNLHRLVDSLWTGICELKPGSNAGDPHSHPQASSLLISEHRE